jgi:imidazoleglycerol phosphate synthase glutamine amidotransferase subunit HisH
MRFLERMGVAYRQVESPDQLTGTIPLILPGVGSFGAVMQHLRKKELAEPVAELVRKGTPFLGVCVGMQILFEGSEESPSIPGLGLLQGQVVKFQHGKVPQIGWNQITPEYFETFCASVHTKNITTFQFHPEKSGKAGERLIAKWLTSVGVEPNGGCP